MAEGTNNTIYGLRNTALNVGPESTTLTIKGKGQMNVYGDAWGDNYLAAGIGTSTRQLGGNLIIEDGIINAYGSYAAAIGSNSVGSTMGDITIKGGTVTATQQSSAGSGIGSGMVYSGESHCGNITITGGNVTAWGGSYAAGIGTGIKYEPDYTNTPVCGDITISGGTVVATKGEYALYDVGPGEVSGNTGIWTGQVGTVNVSVAVKNYYGNDASIYTPVAASAPSRRANADNMSLPLAPDSDVQPKIGKSLRQ